MSTSFLSFVSFLFFFFRIVFLFFRDIFVKLIDRATENFRYFQITMGVRVVCVYILYVYIYIYTCKKWTLTYFLVILDRNPSTFIHVKIFFFSFFFFMLACTLNLSSRVGNECYEDKNEGSMQRTLSRESREEIPVK